MKFFKAFGIVLLGFIIVLPTQAQTNDNIIWATLKLTKSLSEKTSFAVTPIVRINDDVSSYQNTSLDLSIRHKFIKNWHAQFLSRTWWIPDQKGRQFLWFDLGWTKNMSKSKLVSHLRYHLALDINDRSDPDFIRWKTKLTLPPIGRFKPSIAIEPWLRLNGFGNIQRMRYEPGLSYKANDRIDWTLIWRREETTNLSSEVNFNMFVVEMQVKL